MPRGKLIYAGDMLHVPKGLSITLAKDFSSILSVTSNWKPDANERASRYWFVMRLVSTNQTNSSTGHWNIYLYGELSQVCREGVPYTRLESFLSIQCNTLARSILILGIIFIVTTSFGEDITYQSRQVREFIG